MKWLRVEADGFARCYLLPEADETDALLLAAVAVTSFNSAWPEGYGWEQWDPTDEVRLDNVRRVMPGAFRRGAGETGRVLMMDYIGGRRCKTYVSRETRGEHRGRLRLDAAEYEATRGDVGRLLRGVQELLAHRPSGPRGPGGRSAKG
jgi:hypothetical protein